MNLPPTGRDGGEIEAFIVDRYLDSLLARQPLDRIAVDRNVLATANRLTDGLPRFHPSFGFEERLLGQLGALAATLRGPAGAARNEPPVSAIGEARRRPFPVVSPLVPPAVLGRGAPPVRPVVIGGVLTSAAISLAGAAFVAWRRSRPGLDPMARAIRAVARARVI